ncbi:hypothetical protein PG984_011910 [Apiospora sp. TS-2023a]
MGNSTSTQPTVVPTAAPSGTSSSSDRLITTTVSITGSLGGHVTSGVKRHEIGGVPIQELEAGGPNRNEGAKDGIYYEVEGAQAPRTGADHDDSGFPQTEGQ